MWAMTHLCVIWLIRVRTHPCILFWVCQKRHLYVKRDLFTKEEKDKKTCITGTLSSALSMSKETYLREKRPIYKGGKRQKDLYQISKAACKSFLCHCNMTHVSHDTFMCNTTHTAVIHLSHDSFTCHTTHSLVTRLIHLSHDSFGTWADQWDLICN